MPFTPLGHPILLFVWSGIMALSKTCDCGKIIEYTKKRCPECEEAYQLRKAIKKRQRDKEYDRTVRYTRDLEYTKFYHSDEWQRVRQVVLGRDMYLCQWCFKQGVIRPADIVHHIIETKKDWSRRFDLSNLVSLCHECHNKEHGHFGNNNNAP